MIKNIKKRVTAVSAGIGAVAAPLVAMAEPTLTVPEVGTTNLYLIAGSALAFIAVVVAIVAGIKLLKGAK